MLGPGSKGWGFKSEFSQTLLLDWEKNHLLDAKTKCLVFLVTERTSLVFQIGGQQGLSDGRTKSCMLVSSFYNETDIKATAVCNPPKHPWKHHALYIHNLKQNEAKSAHAESTQSMYLWWSLCTLYLLACQVKAIVGDSGLCCCVCVTSFQC